MIYTNKYGVCPEIAEAVISRQKQYSTEGAHYSVTQLIDSPQRVRLMQEHYDEIEIDVVDLLSSWKGHLIHDAIEMDIPRAQYTFGCGKTISGKADYIKDGVIKDYKTTSAWSIVFDSNKKKWEQQLNCYAWLYKKALGIDTNKLLIEVYVTDWSKTKALQDRDYPQSKQFSIPIELWDEARQEDFITSRLENHINWSTLVLCTEEDMWSKPTTFAVMKGDNKRAARVFTDAGEAAEFASYSPQYRVVLRPGARTRCERYCGANRFCPQYKSYIDSLGM